MKTTSGPNVLWDAGRTVVVLMLWAAYEAAYLLARGRRERLRLSESVARAAARWDGGR